MTPGLMVTTAKRSRLVHYAVHHGAGAVATLCGRTVRRGRFSYPLADGPGRPAVSCRRCLGLREEA